MSINIHGKEYVTVSERVTEAHKELKNIDITTEVLFQDPVVIKATVKTEKGLFTGISAANPAKAIEKQSPYEVAETSAIGRALGFAGFGIVEGIATADEMVKSEKSDYSPSTSVSQPQNDLGNCDKCGAPNKLSQRGTKYCSKLCWKNQELPERQVDEVVTSRDDNTETYGQFKETELDDNTHPPHTDNEIDIEEIPF